MSQYPDARFILSANAAGQFLPDTGAEVAFAGRSNAGKSSAINVIVNRRQFARTSKTPGRTQLVNFFSLSDKGERLVDLPGYGYARVAEATRAHWGALVSDYFERRQSLAGVILIVDVRRQLSDFDRQMLRFAGSVGTPLHLLLTKADKLKFAESRRALTQVREELGDRAGVQLFSAVSREGLDEAREVLATFLGRNRQAARKNPGVA